MSNILKSNSIVVSPERMYVFKKRNAVIYYPPENMVSEYSGQDDEDKDDPRDVAKKEAEEILQDAQEQARQIVEAAVKEAEIIKDNAKKDGFEKGFKQGEAQAHKHYENQMKKIEELKNDYITQKERLYNECEQEAVKLAIDIAKKVIDEAMEEDNNLYLKIVEKALKKIRGESQVQLRVSSSDYPVVVEARDFLTYLVEGLDNIAIIEDESLKKGDCVVDTGSGIVDGGVQTQIDQIKAAFEFILEGNK